MTSELEALKKLDEAIQAMKAVGYRFRSHKIIDEETFGTKKDFFQRYVQVDCYKSFPVSENRETAEIRQFTSFSQRAEYEDNPLGRLLVLEGFKKTIENQSAMGSKNAMQDW